MKFKETAYGDMTGQVTKSIILRDKNITSLEGCPKEVTASLQITNTTKYVGLTSLKGSPKKCGNFSIWGNNLTSLEGGPTMIKFDYDVSNNYRLKDLTGAPKKCENFVCNHIGIRSKQELVIEILKSGMNVTGKVIGDYDNFSMHDKDDKEVQAAIEWYKIDNITKKKIGKFKDFLDL